VHHAVSQTHRPIHFIPRQGALTKEEDDEETGQVRSIEFFYEGNRKFMVLKGQDAPVRPSGKGFLL